MKSAAPDLLTGMHVLLVEDQSLIALDTEMLLRELGAQAVETFTSAEAALAWLTAASPDVSVLDINRHHLVVCHRRRDPQAGQALHLHHRLR
jgi:CheY-like chemotaxis protein